MTPEEIKKDREARRSACTADIESALHKYEFALSAEDFLTPGVKLTVEVKLADFKKYDSLVAEPANVTETLTK